MPPVADRLVAAGERGQVGDAGLLEPDDERRVVGDALRVGLGEADADAVREGVAVHRGRRYTPRLGWLPWEPPRSSRR